MPHDDSPHCAELNGPAGSSRRVMAPVMSSVPPGEMWSPCSARFITDFLDNGHGTAPPPQPPVSPPSLGTPRAAVSPPRRSLPPGQALGVAAAADGAAGRRVPAGAAVPAGFRHGLAALRGAAAALRRALVQRPCRRASRLPDQALPLGRRHAVRARQSLRERAVRGHRRRGGAQRECRDAPGGIRVPPAVV